MSKPPLTLALLFGGRSPEHEVSIRSARNLIAAMDPEQYRVILIAISKAGAWYQVNPGDLSDPDFDIARQGRRLALIPGTEQGQICYQEDLSPLPQIDVVFPITHGPYGEDGTLQGLLHHLNLPFVGPDVLGSAASMDKDVAKRLLREADLLVADGLTFQYYEQDAIDYAAVRNQLGSPLFIKPANMGSSVGVSRADDAASFAEAVKSAFRYDHKILVESAIEGRELECAVLGNASIATTHVGEVAMVETQVGLYDYESKYLSETAAQVLIPAPDIDNQILAKLMLVAKNAYRTLCCEGMARVDMFLCEDGRVYVNEVNTLPGFTSISMYPKLWAHAGTTYSELIDELVQLALERARRSARLQKSL